MSGVLDGIEVLDLSWGIGGPMAGMLLADHGARVTKIEPPGGDPTRCSPARRSGTAGSAARSSTSTKSPIAIGWSRSPNAPTS